MPTVAEQLRAAREAAHLTVEKVAEMTKIRTDHIRALEEGNFNRFPALIYIRGSVKNYAMKLKLDVPKIMAVLDAELKGTEKFSEPPALVEHAKSPLEYVMFWLSKVNAKLLLGAGVIFGIVLLVMVVKWAVHARQGRHPLAGPPPAVYQMSNSGDTLPLPTR
jgi:cytoskeletal protein RodZ